MRHGESTKIRKQDKDILEFIDLRTELKEALISIRIIRNRMKELDKKLKRK